MKYIRKVGFILHVRRRHRKSKHASDSTRGGIAPVPFGKVVLDGYADDGGLYVPEFYPQLDIEKLRQCSNYSDLAFNVFRPFIDQAELRNVS